MVGLRNLHARNIFEHMSDSKLNAALAEAQAAELAIAAAQARQFRALALIAKVSCDPDGVLPFGQFTASQVAAALHWTEATASKQLQLAVQLTGRLRGTLSALERGDIDVRRA